MMEEKNCRSMSDCEFFRDRCGCTDERCQPFDEMPCNMQSGMRRSMRCGMREDVRQMPQQERQRESMPERREPVRQRPQQECQRGSMPERREPVRQMPQQECQRGSMPERRESVRQMPQQECQRGSMPERRESVRQMPQQECQRESMPECMRSRQNRQVRNNSNSMNRRHVCSSCGSDNIESNNVNENSRRQAMRNIYELGFVLIETMLYLDTHPNDQQAIEYYNEIMNKYNEYASKFARFYGPLNAFDMTNENYWTWVATPMPWEVED